MPGELSRESLVSSHVKINVCYSLAGRSVLGETVPEVLSFFLLRFKSFRKILLPPLTYALKKGAFVLMLFKARDRLQTKTKY